MNNVKWYGKAVEKEVHGITVAKLTQAALLVERDAKKTVRVDTGRLRASITHEIDPKDLKARVGTNVKYGVWVEVGSEKWPGGAPYWRPALAANQGNIKRLFGR